MVSDISESEEPLALSHLMETLELADGAYC